MGEYLRLVILMNILDRCTTSCFCLGNGDGLNLDVWCGLVKMYVEADDVLSSPTVTCPTVGVHCPVFDTLFQHDMGITLLKGKVHILVTESESGQHIMVTTDNDADGAVRTVIGDAQGIVLVHIGFKFKFI